MSRIRYTSGMKVGETLRALRQGRGWSQNELAAHSGVSRVVISQYETGAREPSFTAFTRLARATGHTLQLKPLPDDVATAETLEDVLELAESLPHSRFDPLPPSPFPLTRTTE